MTIDKEKLAAEWLKNIIDFPDLEGPEIWHAVYYLDQINGSRPDLDKKYVENLRLAAPATFEYPPPTQSPSWKWKAHEIIEGKYPLELLPVHVREIARKLYYKN